MAYILLVRHGQNDWVKKNRLAGWTPGVHLNEEGQKQVEDLAQRLAELPIKAIYSSPLERCMETAEAVARLHKLDIHPLEAVGEVRYGEWEGEKIKKLAKEKAWYAVQHFPSRFRFPGGESFTEVQQRVVDAIEKINGQHKKEMVVVVSHADVIKLALAHYMGTHIDLFQRIGLSPASVSVLALGEGGGVHVLRVNDNGPIKPPPPPEDKEKKDKEKAESSEK
jgi:probable phosphoglycerate mutase